MVLGFSLNVSCCSGPVETLSGPFKRAIMIMVSEENDIWAARAIWYSDVADFDDQPSLSKLQFGRDF